MSRNPFCDTIVYYRTRPTFASMIATSMDGLRDGMDIKEWRVSPVGALLLQRSITSRAGAYYEPSKSFSILGRPIVMDATLSARECIAVVSRSTTELDAWANYR